MVSLGKTVEIPDEGKLNRSRKQTAHCLTFYYRDRLSQKCLVNLVLYIILGQLIGMFKIEFSSWDDYCRLNWQFGGTIAGRFLRWSQPCPNDILRGLV